MIKPLPEAFLQSLDGVAGFHRDAFVGVHASGETVTSVRQNIQKSAGGHPQIGTPEGASVRFTAVPWTKTGFYVDPRPSFTFDPLFHAGAYYVQEASSMFLEQAIRQLSPVGEALRVLDLCAAPGGKSTHMQSLLPDGSLLVSNEVIRTRVPMLTDNIIRWGAANVMLTNNDPTAFAKLPSFFDVVVVDAPCSGSGLFRKDPGAIHEWSLANVQLCSERQQRILADALPCLREGGLLVYSTCSYSREEDEAIGDWLVETLGLEPLELQVQPEWGIVESRTFTGTTGYRFYPDQTGGEGFFLACFRKPFGEGPAKEKKMQPERATAKEGAILQTWLRGAFEFLRAGDRFFALPAHLLAPYTHLRSALHITHAGVMLGQIMKDRLVPDHALALSVHLNEGVSSIPLSYDTAIRYLQRQEIRLDGEQRGWAAVGFEGRNLGWVNVLPNRVNNYYPKEIRILKQSDHRS